MLATLTDRQARFVFEYLLDQNASAAARRAGYSAAGSASQGSALMRDPLVRDCIRIELRGLLADLKVSALDLMRERMKAAFFRASKLFGPGGRVLEMEEMDPDTRDALMVSIDRRGNDPVIRIRQPNRERALAALERVHERLERQSEAYYEKLEFEGVESPELEETAAAESAPATPAREPGLITPARRNQTPERAAPVPRAVKNAEKPSVLSGSTPIAARLAGALAALMPGKPRLKTNPAAHLGMPPDSLKHLRPGTRPGPGLKPVRSPRAGF
jgi:hypothetical protein